MTDIKGQTELSKADIKIMWNYLSVIFWFVHKRDGQDKLSGFHLLKSDSCFCFKLAHTSWHSVSKTERASLCMFPSGP